MFVAAIGSTAAGILLVARDDGKHSSAFAACDNARVCVCGGLTKKIHANIVLRCAECRCLKNR